MLKYFINILGFFLFLSIGFSQETPQETSHEAPKPDADFKALVLKVGDALKIVENFSPEQLRSCSLMYEIPGKIYFFQDKQTFEQFRVCQNLREVACEKKQMDTAALNKIAQSNEKKYHEIEADASGYAEKIRARLATLSPPNPLLREDPQEALDAHSAFLDQQGREAMAEFFKTHYSHKNSTVEDYTYGLYSVHADALDRLEKLGLITYEQRWIELPALIKEDIPDEKLHEGLLKVYQLLFEKLPEEDLRAYIKNFVTVQYSKFKDDLYFDLPKNTSFVERVTTELFPQEQRQKVENILNDIKAYSQKFLMEGVSQKSPLKKEGLKKIQAITLEWPSKNSDILTKLSLLGSVTQENASYLGEGGHNEMQVNGLSLHAPYWRMFGQLAHEVGHSLQPHEEPWRSFWKKFVECIRQPDLDFKEHHTEEIFADWFSAELLTRHIQERWDEKSSDGREEMRDAVLESVGFCDPPSQYAARVRKGLTAEMVPNPHPDSDARVNKILRAHPFVNKLFGCPDSPPYCAP